MAIFNRLSQEQYLSGSVSVSYLEIYNEELCDLLCDLPDPKDPTPGTKLQIVEERGKRGKGVYCRGLSEHPVKSAADILEKLQEAQERKQIGETKMNKNSSRKLF
jgi:kinesin family protein 11